MVAVVEDVDGLEDAAEVDSVVDERSPADPPHVGVSVLRFPTSALQFGA